MSFQIPVGEVCEEEFKVLDVHTAKHVGSGDVSVLSTPSMIAFMEGVALRCLQKHLPEEYTSVGVLVNVKHLNPAPSNSVVKVKASITSVEGRKVVFSVQATYKDMVIGEGVHERFIVNRKRFADKIREILSS
ncbi:thioesterase family protein [Thermosphaera chiliense]|uniref:Thioesterase family protein n=2 Tax=Thermosphaera chiliense TaxID=3402707 RepID=A0A7M1USJ8_9CREN|nr:thioesterase family protein [Thermosphaera aggregans]